MPVINLRHLVKEWYSNTYGGNHTPRGKHINFDNVRVEYTGKVHWTREGQVIVNGPAKLVQIKKREDGRYHSDFYTQIHVGAHNDYLWRITLTDTLIIGPKEMVLSLDYAGLPRKFDTSITINPSVAVSQDTIPGNSSALSKGKTISDQPRIARVQCKTNEYEGRFSCKVAISGKVICNGFQHNITEIIKDLQENYDQYEREDLDALTCDHRHVYLHLQGEGEFRWPADHKVDVQWIA